MMTKRRVWLIFRSLLIAALLLFAWAAIVPALGNAWVATGGDHRFWATAAVGAVIFISTVVVMPIALAVRDWRNK